jgi:hypothetical protein
MKLIDGPPIPMEDIQSILDSPIPFGDENNPEEVEHCEVRTFDILAKSILPRIMVAHLLCLSSCEYCYRGCSLHYPKKTSRLQLRVHMPIG